MAEQNNATSPSCLATASSSRAGNNVARIQRNVAEKQRRDKLNGYISELANIVPMISKSSRRLDKTSILRLSAAHLRICKSPLGGNKTNKTLKWCPSFLSNEQIREILESVDGFLIITSSNGKVMFTSRSVERYLGHQDIDMIGHSLYMFIHEKDIDDVKQKMKDVLAECTEKGSSRCSFECLMKEKAQPRSEVSTYQHVHFVGGMTAADDPNSEKPKSVITHMFKAFVKVVDISPYNQLSLEEATADEYVTRHSLDGTIIFADHRLATITGHMPNEVIGLSAYEYIHKDDTSIALFAHHLMFSSDKGTGIIVYRLRTRDDRHIYLKSVGCLQYDNTTSQVDHFVCINQQLGDSDGDLQLKYFFDQYIPHVKGSSASTLLESVKALQSSSSKSSPINHKTNGSVSSGNCPSSPGNSESNISSISSDGQKCHEENSSNEKMDHFSDSGQKVIQDSRGSLSRSPDFIYDNTVSPPSSVFSQDELENKEKGLETIASVDDSECIIVTVNGCSSETVNGIFTSSINSYLNVNQSRFVDTHKISSPLQTSKNSCGLIEGPNYHVNSNLKLDMGPAVFNSNGENDKSMSPSEVKDGADLQVDAQYEYIRTLSVSEGNKSKNSYTLVKFSDSPHSECKKQTVSDEEINLYCLPVNGKISLSQNEISSVCSNSPLEIQSDNHHECVGEPFIKHSSFIRNTNGVDSLHSTLTVVNSRESDCVLRNSKWSVDSFGEVQSAVEDDSPSSMDYCDTMSTVEDEISGDLKDNLSFQEDLSSLLSATLPHSDSNSLPSANGWNDIFNPTPYSSPFSNETALQKEDEQLLITSKLKSSDLW